MLRAPDGGDLEETAAVTFTVTGSETAVATRSSLAKTSGTASTCTTASLQWWKLWHTMYRKA